MNAHGYCTNCHKVKRIRLTSQVIARMGASGVPVGVCEDCNDRAKEKSR